MVSSEDGPRVTDVARQSRSAVGVMARTPSSGGKTRLAPHIPAERLAALRTALLVDTLHTVAALPDIVPVVFFTPPDGEAEIAALARRSIAAVPQVEGDLGERMRSAFDHLLVDHRHAVIIGTDMPLLTADSYRRGARDASRERRRRARSGRRWRVLPDWDDGGARRPVREDCVGRESRARRHARAADRLGIKVHRLRSGYDVDTIEDLRRLERDLAGAPPELAPHVRRWFSEGQ